MKSQAFEFDSFDPKYLGKLWEVMEKIVAAECKTALVVYDGWLAELRLTNCKGCETPFN